MLTSAASDATATSSSSEGPTIACASSSSNAALPRNPNPSVTEPNHAVASVWSTDGANCSTNQTSIPRDCKPRIQLSLTQASPDERGLLPRAPATTIRVMRLRAPRADGGGHARLQSTPQ